MKGLLGAPSQGTSYKHDRLRRIPDLLRAKDLLTLANRGVEVPADVLDVSRKVMAAPTYASRKQLQFVFAIWMKFAKTGMLRGIRNAVASSSNEPIDTL